MKERLEIIDGLRGVAAFSVVLGHLSSRTALAGIMGHGYLGVSIFFVLSGFVIAMSVDDRFISASFAGRFAARRAIRLDPPYWASIAVALTLTWFAARNGFPREIPGAAELFAHLFYLQDILGFESISSVYWTLCYEIQFYLFFLVMMWLRQHTRGFWFLWCAVFVVSLAELAELIDISGNAVFLQYWFSFAMGAMTYWAVRAKIHPAALVAAAAATLSLTFSSHAPWCITTVLTVIVIYWGVRRNSAWLSAAPVQFLGRISYSMYLFHPLVGWTAMSIALKFSSTWIAFLVGVIASIVSAWVAYYLIERPSVRLSRFVSVDRAKASPIAHQQISTKQS
ncbi:MAG: acyltransferase [Pseudomonadota bacterium]